MQCISVLLGSDDLERAECETYERVSDSESKKGSSGLAKECKDVPEVQGIPIPKQRWFRCDRLVHTLLACLLICSPWIRRQGLKEQRFLSANKVSVEVTNCQVIVQDGTQPGILLQRWFFMGTVKERSKEGNLRLVATMRCSACNVNSFVRHTCLKVIEFQVDAVFDAMLQNMTARIKQEQEDTVSSYDGDDLIFALKKADNRFQGLDAEDQPLRQFSKDPLCRCVKPDTEMIKQIQERALTSLEGEMTSEQLQQLAELYKHYLGKTSFEKLLKNAGITLPKPVIESLFGQLDDITLQIGEVEEFVCEDLVSISYDTFADMILKDMRFVVNDSQIRLLFNMVDRSGNGSISKAEFIEGFHTLMRQLVPHIILNSLSVLPEQIASHILKALILLLLLFAFLFVSMDALTPSFETGNMDFMGGVQAAVAGMAALGVRMQSTSGMNKERIQAP
eukprot:Skav206596  [mRNA]  locus=scaffold4512:70876:83358:+ [translate_table: standard]